MILKRLFKTITLSKEPSTKFARFFTEANTDEKEHVLLEAADSANKKQREVVERYGRALIN